jgi:glutamyl-tRNA synthetase
VVVTDDECRWHTGAVQLGTQVGPLVTGRFAPSPTGRLHLGNLRTALVAWLSARSVGGRFFVRVEDLDRVTSSAEHERQQLADLASLGLDWDDPVLRQSERFAAYDDAIDRLRAADRVYECYCTRADIRREIDAAARAPHADELSVDQYPGTCRRLSARERSRRASSGRRPALRFAAEHTPLTVVDRWCGTVHGTPGDVVVRRNDGIPAYNVAVVVDDAAQAVTEVVRGADLLGVTPSQVHLAHTLGLPVPTYAHVPLVLGPDGQRLAKRHGAVTLHDFGGGAAEAVRRLAVSLELAEAGEPVDVLTLLGRWHGAIPAAPYVWVPG